MRSVLFLAAVAGLLSSADSVAQTVGRHVFDLVPAQSNFSFSGNVTFAGINGRIVGNPSTFNVSGQASADLGLSAVGVGTGQLVEGNGTIVTIPTLNARVPNPLPFLPDLANVTITGATAVFSSVDANGAPASFPVARNGDFGATVGGQLLSGTAVITGIVNQTIPLAGQTTTPQAVSGSIVTTAGGLRLTVGISTSIVFSDVSTGASGTINLTGQLVADDQALSTAQQSISLRTGGSQTMRLSAGSGNGGRSYAVLATASGTTPGLTLNGVNIPVNFDGFTSLPLDPSPLYAGTVGNFDARGLATAMFMLPPLPVSLNLQLHHAYAVLNGTTVTSASNAILVNITP